MLLTDELLGDVVSALETKAEHVSNGELGEEDKPGDDAAWVHDLREAARLLSVRDFKSLQAIHLEGIECAYGADEVTAEIERLAEEK